MQVLSSPSDGRESWTGSGIGSGGRNSDIYAVTLRARQTATLPRNKKNQALEMAIHNNSNNQRCNRTGEDFPVTREH